MGGVPWNDETRDLILASEPYPITLSYFRGEEEIHRQSLVGPEAYIPPPPSGVIQVRIQTGMKERLIFTSEREDDGPPRKPQWVVPE